MTRKFRRSNEGDEGQAGGGGRGGGGLISSASHSNIGSVVAVSLNHGTLCPQARRGISDIECTDKY